MMLTSGLVAMSLLALGFVVAALFFRAGRGQDDQSIGPDSRQYNIDSFRQQETELEEQLRRGEVDEAQHRNLLVEAQRSLLSDVALDAAPGAGTTASQREISSCSGRLLVLISAIVVLLAWLLYAQLGAKTDLEIRHELQKTDFSESAQLATKIRQRLKSQPDNLYYHLLSARFYQYEQEPDSAIQAFKEALRISPEDIDLRGEYAQALYLAANQVVTPEVNEQIDGILRANPKQPVALSLRGIGAFSEGDYQVAIDSWMLAVNALPVDSEAALAMRNGINNARERLLAAESSSALAGTNESHPGEATLSNAGQADDQSSNGVLRVRVSLADKLQVAPEALVFVYVKEWQGPPMPLMAQRLMAADLPFELSFSDDQALVPGRGFGGISQFEVVARISHSGTPTANSGDFEGRSGPLESQQLQDVGLDVVLHIDTLVP